MSKISTESTEFDALAIKYSCGCQFIFARGAYYPQLYFCTTHKGRVKNFGWLS